MITTAEGVETEQQLEILRAEGCVQVQGYLFSQPKPGSEIPAMLQQLRPRIRAA
jgi:EAL domain-containing protein (putative c-di-GMP-specific phosphodiesterase class I)